MLSEIYRPPVPCKPKRDLCPGKASKSMFIFLTSISQYPAVWAASTINIKPRDFDKAPIVSISCTVPNTFEPWLTIIAFVLLLTEFLISERLN